MYSTSRPTIVILSSQTTYWHCFQHVLRQLYHCRKVPKCSKHNLNLAKIVSRGSLPKQQNCSDNISQIKDMIFYLMSVVGKYRFWRIHAHAHENAPEIQPRTWLISGALSFPNHARG